MECSFYPISCSFEHCEEKIERYALADHQSLCPYKTEACCYCKHICLSSELPVFLFIIFDLNRILWAFLSYLIPIYIFLALAEIVLEKFEKKTLLLINHLS